MENSSILVATPGRLNDFLDSRQVPIDLISYNVFETETLLGWSFFSVLSCNGWGWQNVGHGIWTPDKRYFEEGDKCYFLKKIIDLLLCSKETTIRTSQENSSQVFHPLVTTGLLPIMFIIFLNLKVCVRIPTSSLAIRSNTRRRYRDLMTWNQLNSLFQKGKWLCQGKNLFRHCSCLPFMQLAQAGSWDVWNF